MHKRATIKEIAEECNVSIATVSRVFNGSSAVAPRTRELVEEAIKRSGYTPNALARSLVNNRTMTLGVVVPDISNPYFAALFTQVEHAALQAGYTVILLNTFYVSSTYGQLPPLPETAYFDMLLRRKVDGALILGGQMDLVKPSADYVDALRRLCHGMPVVALGKEIPDVDAVFIDAENEGGIISAVQYLASLGHRKIAFVGGEPGVTITERRLEAYRSTLSALQLPADERLIATSDYYAKDGYLAAQRLLAGDCPFTAALAINDSVALGLIRALADQKLSVPQDISVISCEQLLNADYAVPRLTSIDQHSDWLGKLLIQALLSAINGVGEPAVIRGRPELIIRESCAPVKTE